MADPFEVRMKFSSYLTHLSANQTSLMKTAHFALKHRDMDEDLHSCILEALERQPSSTTATGGGGGNGNGNSSSSSNNNNSSSSSSSSSMNNRANIMYFLDQHADVNVREGGHAPYVDFLRRDIARIVEAVAVNGANVKVCRRVVGGLGEKKVLAADEVAVIERGLREREERMGRLLGGRVGDEEDEDEDEDGDEEEEEEEQVRRRQRQQMEDSRQLHRQQQQQQQRRRKQEVDEDSEMADVPGREEERHVVPVAGGRKKGGVDRDRDRERERARKVDKRAIEQRIEEDRERNKRLRESMWAVTGNDDDELDKMWDEGSDVTQEDYDIANEEADERRRFARYHHSTTTAALTAAAATTTAAAVVGGGGGT